MELVTLDESVKAELTSCLKKFLVNGYRFPSRESLNYMHDADGFLAHSTENLIDTLRIVLPNVPRVISPNEIILHIDAHADTLTNEDYLLTGHSGGALSK